MGACCQSKKTSYEADHQHEKTANYDERLNIKPIFVERPVKKNETTIAVATANTNVILRGSSAEGLVKMVAKSELVEILESDMSMRMHKFIGAIWCSNGKD